MNDEENLTLHQKSLKALFHTHLHLLVSFLRLGLGVPFLLFKDLGGHSMTFLVQIFVNLTNG